MAFPISVTYTFGTQTGAIPLNYLDTNFNNLVTGVNGISSGTNAMVTPVLGTPGSGTLTNCTGFPSANLSGAVPLTKGGTGQITANASLNALLPSQSTQSGKYLTTDGTNTSWASNPLGTVTSVAQSFTGGLISVAGSPITSSGTLALTVAGTSGGIPYFSGASTWASSAVLASNALMVGGGAGVAPSTVTTGTGVVTALGVNTGTAGAFVVNGGALGTPSSGTVTNLTGTASININGTVGATTASTGAFTTLSASSTVSGTGFSTYLASPPAIGGTAAAAGTFTQLTVNGASVNTSISPTGTGTVTISPAGALTINPTAASTINNTSIGATTRSTGAFTTLGANGAITIDTTTNNQSFTTTGAGVITMTSGTAGNINNMNVGATTAGTGAFTSLTATSRGGTGVLATNSGLTANTTVTNTATFTTAGVTLASQTAAAGSVWRIRAYGQFVAASSATVRTAQIACFWGTTQLTAITPTILASTAQTTQWQIEFELSATSTTAIWTTGTLISRIASATALAIDNATSASTAVTAGAQTLDLQVRASSAVAAESWVIQQVTIERLE